MYFSSDYALIGLYLLDPYQYLSVLEILLKNLYKWLDFVLKSEVFSLLWSLLHLSPNFYVLFIVLFLKILSDKLWE